MQGFGRDFLGFQSYPLLCFTIDRHHEIAFRRARYPGSNLDRRLSRALTCDFVTPFDEGKAKDDNQARSENNGDNPLHCSTHHGGPFLYGCALPGLHSQPLILSSPEDSWLPAQAFSYLEEADAARR